MNGMAEVVAEHYINYVAGAWKCTSLSCSFSSAHFDAAMGHVGEALTAAGFGDLQTEFATTREAE